MAEREPVPVVVVGAGPVGLALALGLARHGVRSMLVERTAGPSEHSKAPGVHVRTLEVLREWGVDAAVRAAGTLLREVVLHDARDGRPRLRLDLGILDDEAHDPGLLILPQSHTERLLLDAVRATGRCDVRLSTEVVGLSEGTDRVTVTTAPSAAGPAGNGKHPAHDTVHARYVVGCDGPGSTVRRCLGLALEGHTYPLSPLLADVTVTDDRDRLPWPRLDSSRGGLTGAARLSASTWRIVDIERTGPHSDEDPEDHEVHDRVAAVLGAGDQEVLWSSRFQIHRRAVERMRRGRVLLAGDAAHLHSPAGGQGMNAGIQDAHALAWRLRACLDGGPVDLLLDSYDVERRAVVAGDVSHFTGALTRLVLQAPSSFVRAGLKAGGPALRFRPVARLVARRMGMLDLGYRTGPLVGSGRGAGVRLPDVELVPRDGAPVRLRDVVGGRWALVGVAPAGPASAEPADVVRGLKVVWIDGVRLSEPSGRVARLIGRGRWCLVRPDGHLLASDTDPDLLLRRAAPLLPRH